jgi:hypothetical protein
LAFLRLLRCLKRHETNQQAQRIVCQKRLQNRRILACIAGVPRPKRTVHAILGRTKKIIISSGTSGSGRTRTIPSPMMVVPSPTFLLVAARKPKIVTSSTSNNLAVQSMTPIVDTHGKERRRAAENLDHFLVQSLCFFPFFLFLFYKV